MLNKRNGLAIATAVALLGSMGAAWAGPAENKANAIAFVEAMFNQHKVAEGFEKYVGNEYIQHNPNVASGVEASKQALAGWVASLPPTFHVEIKHVAADGDLVFLHQHYVAGPDDPGTAVVDILRFDGNGKIVEHWDVLQQVPAKSANDNTMF